MVRLWFLVGFAGGINGSAIDAKDAKGDTKQELSNFPV
jgi:hypothetical protein